ncbi:MAG: hypothetical protein QOE41_5047 [Mycobacterium sp.]|nr:hypothetical protein [Mycobacterium sp.]MDT5135736.1 hypothetical protein [Mycobacterium sp.]
MFESDTHLVEDIKLVEDIELVVVNVAARAATASTRTFLIHCRDRNAVRITRVDYKCREDYLGRVVLEILVATIFVATIFVSALFVSEL